MAKVVYPLFPNNKDILKFRPNKNLKGGFTHVVFINKLKKRKGVEK